MVPCHLRVIYGDTDQMGVVYYANYLRWFEAGRGEYCRENRIPYRELERDGYFLPVVEAHVRYSHPARYEDRVVVETRVTEVGRSRLRFAYQVNRDDGVALASGFTVHACLGEAGRLVRLPAHVREALKRAEEEDA